MSAYNPRSFLGDGLECTKVVQIFALILEFIALFYGDKNGS